jgi:hypothetical protein
MLPIHRISPHSADPLTGNSGPKLHARTMGRYLSIIYILCSLGLGINLLWLPWQSIWENNYLLYIYPQLRPVITNPFFKGGVLGLGIANLIIGFYEIVRFKNTSKGCLPR